MAIPDPASGTDNVDAESKKPNSERVVRSWARTGFGCAVDRLVRVLWMSPFALTLALLLLYATPLDSGLHLFVEWLSSQLNGALAVIASVASVVVGFALAIFWARRMAPRDVLRAMLWSVILLRPTIVAWSLVWVPTMSMSSWTISNSETSRDMIGWSATDQLAVGGWLLLGALTAVALVPLAIPGWDALWRTVEEDRAHGRCRQWETERKLAGSAGPVPTEWEFGELQAWFESDTPVTHPCEDYFGHAEIAESIARRIHCYSEDWTKPASIQLLGPKGSGKSSIRGMTDTFLRLDGRGNRLRHYQIVPVSVWEYRDSDAVYRAVLRALIEGLGRVAPVTDLQSLPSSYAKLINRANGVAGSLAELASGQRDPADLIALIGRRAMAAQVNVIVWIDDMERFQSEQPEAVHAVGSLLVLIRQTPGISFVLANGSLPLQRPQSVSEASHSTDYEKLVDATEVIAIDTDKVRRLLSSFRQHCLRFADGKVLFPVDPDDGMTTLDHLSGDAILSMRGIGSVAGALVAVFQTPRQLKTGLRRVWHAWGPHGDLMGEISFDGFMCFAALRERTEDILIGKESVELITSTEGIVVDHSARALSWGGLMSNARLLSIVLSPPDKDRSDQMLATRSSIDASAIALGRALTHTPPSDSARIERTDPGLALLMLAGGRFRTRNTSQSPFQPHSIYMERAISERVRSDERDQPALRHIKGLMVPESSIAGEKIRELLAQEAVKEESPTFDAIVRFREMLNGPSIWAICYAVLAKMPQALHRTATLPGETPEVFMRIRYLMPDGRSIEDARINLAADASKKMAREGRLDISFLCLYWWGPPRNRINPTLETWWSTCLEALAPEVVIATETAEGLQLFVSVLREATPWLLYHCIVGEWVNPSDSVIEKWKQPDPLSWKRAAEVFIRAGKIDPCTVGTALSCLISKSTERSDLRDSDIDDEARAEERFEVVIDTELFEQLFSECLQQAYELLAAIDPDKASSVAEAVRLEAARQRATAWLRKRGDE